MFNHDLKTKMHDFIINCGIDTSLRGIEAYRTWMKSTFYTKASPLHSTTHITQPKRWADKNFYYSASTTPTKFEGPIWDSSFTMMFPTILKENFGYVMINEYSIEDIIDTLLEMRKEYKKQQAVAHMGWLNDDLIQSAKMCNAQYAAKSIMNCLYGYLLTCSDFNNIDFEMTAQDKFDHAAKTIIENGGILIHASVDSFVYKSELPITFDESQHNDKFSNVLSFGGGYAADIGKSCRLRTNSVKVLERISREQKKRFLK